MMKIAFIGIGNVGAPLADRLQQLGHQIVIAARDPQSQTVLSALSRNPALLVQSPDKAIASADVVFLVTPFSAVESALTPLKSALSGKILVDCINQPKRGNPHPSSLFINRRVTNNLR